MATTTTRWTAGLRAQAWRDGANWSAGVPAAGGVALFNAPGLVIDLSRGGGPALLAGRIDVAGGSVTFTGGRETAASPPEFPGLFENVGLRVNDATLIIAAGASLLGQQYVEIGDRASATVEIHGVLVDSTATIGRGAASKVTVSGSGAAWRLNGAFGDLQVGGFGAGTLEVSGGGRVGISGNFSTSDFYRTTIGGVAASGTALVTGRGSSLTTKILDVGGQYNGTLTIADGAHVTDQNGNVGDLGDGVVTVSGRGTVWTNTGGLFIDGFIPHGSVTITDHARVTFGDYGLQDQASLLLDSTARLEGAIIVLAGGAISAIPTPGVADATVVISQAISLSYNYKAAGLNIGNFVGGAAGTTLELTGRITRSLSFASPLTVGGGHVKLDNSSNGDFFTNLYGGVLEIAATGAAGSLGLSFVGTQTAATIQIDSGVTLANTISGLGLLQQDAIDVRDIGFGLGTTLAYAPSGANGGVLSVANGVDVATLNLSGAYTAAGFAAADDGLGGTLVTYHATA